MMRAGTVHLLLLLRDIPWDDENDNFNTPR